MKKILSIKINRTSYIVSILDKKAISLIQNFLKSFETFKWTYNFKSKKYSREKDKSFYSYDSIKNEYRFTIYTLKNFFLLLRQYNVNKDELDIENCDLHDLKKLGVKFNNSFKPKEHQKDYVKELKKLENPIELVPLQTGKGKSFLGSKAIFDIGFKAAIVIKPMYIDKWIDDIKKYFDIEDHDLMVIQGRDQLNGLIDLAMNNGKIKPKIFIFSNTTLSRFIKEYENSDTIDDFNYLTTPDKITDILGIGTLLIDEVHQWFHAVFKISLYFNVMKIIGLSATLESNDPGIVKQYKNLFPDNVRLELSKYDRYIDIIAVRYLLKDKRLIRLSMQYNHTEFEKSVMRHKELLVNYLNMIGDLIESKFIVKYKEGDKLAVFASSIKFCTILTNYVKNRFRNVSVERYVEDDPYENVIEPVIRISTILSSGTAIDIPGLTDVINTINIASIQANKQTLGRLRKIDNRKTTFYYIWAGNIAKHQEFHNLRLKMLRPISKTFGFEDYENKI